VLFCRLLDRGDDGWHLDRTTVNLPLPFEAIQWVKVSRLFCIALLLRRSCGLRLGPFGVGDLGVSIDYAACGG
jgi:hypothetical protein